jgi:hypothetical protein
MSYHMRLAVAAAAILTAAIQTVGAESCPAQARQHSPADWMPVCSQKMQQNEGLETRSDSRGMEMALALTVQPGNVHKPINGINYAVGSTSMLGFFESTDGKCAFTLMLSKRRDAEASTPDRSAVEVQVAIRPGEDAQIGNTQGEDLRLTCNAGARTVSVVQSRAAPNQ